MKRHDVRWAILAALLITACSTWGFFAPVKGKSWNSASVEIRFDLLPGMFLTLSDINWYVQAYSLRLALGIALSLIWYFCLCYAAIKVARLLVCAIMHPGDARWALIGGALLGLIATSDIVLGWPWIDRLLIPASYAIQYMGFICFPISVLLELMMAPFNHTTGLCIAAFVVSLLSYFVLCFWTIKVWRFVFHVVRFINRPSK